jgi:hypothetical protein
MNIFKRSAFIFKQSAFANKLEKHYKMLFLTGQIDYSIKITTPSANTEQGTAHFFIEIQNSKYLSEPLMYEFAMIFVKNQNLSRELFELRFESIIIGAVNQDKLMRFDLIL